MGWQQCKTCKSSITCHPLSKWVAAMVIKMHSIRKLGGRLQIQMKDAECNQSIPVSCGWNPWSHRFRKKKYQRWVEIKIYWKIRKNSDLKFWNDFPTENFFTKNGLTLRWAVNGVRPILITTHQRSVDTRIHVRDYPCPPGSVPHNYERFSFWNIISGNDPTTDCRIYWKTGARKEANAPITPSAKS